MGIQGLLIRGLQEGPMVWIVDIRESRPMLRMRIGLFLYVDYSRILLQLQLF